jgi:predicted glutamine amidotransferase
MCIAILQKAGSGLIDKDRLKNCWDNNPHGAGFMYANSGRIFCFKSFKFDKFYEAYKNDREMHPDLTFVLHFRWASAGKISLDNTHPFMINDSSAFCHNGHLAKYANDKKISDTRLFNSKILAKLPNGWQKNKAIIILLKQYTVGSKFIFLFADGSSLILNQKAGHWLDSIWYSNYGYCPPAPEVEYLYEELTKDYLPQPIVRYNSHKSCVTCGGPLAYDDYWQCKHCYEKWNYGRVPSRKN